MTAQLIIEMVFHLLGGLGIFLLGMKYMQQGLQVVAGERIRRMINAVTSNRIFAVGVGLFVTTLVQSSSVTSVMVIGMVNSELMALEAALGVIIGANIGTTITGWILALKVGKYGLPLLGMAAFGWLFIRTEKTRYAALSLLGIGMVFFGLELMKNGFKPVHDLPEFVAWFQMFEAADYLGVLKSAMVGCVATLIIQSSSATLGIVIALANTGVIDFQTAAALVLGTNIGTTITAYLASLGADDINARRTAYFHILFNVGGVAGITVLFHPFYLPFIIKYVMGGTNPNLQTAGGSFPYMTAAIASVHTIFNVLTALLVIPFLTPIARALRRWIKDRRVQRAHLTHLEFNLVASPITGIEESRSEIVKMDRHVRGMLDNLRAIISSPSSDRQLCDRVFEREKILDDVQLEITRFLTDLLAEELSHNIAREARAQLRLADEYESVSDYISNVLKLYLRLREAGVEPSEAQASELRDLHDVVADYFDMVHQGLWNGGDPGYAARIHEGSGGITNKIRELRDRHWNRLSTEAVDPLMSTSYMDIANAYRRIKDHMLNIGEAIVGEKPLEPRRPRAREEESLEPKASDL